MVDFNKSVELAMHNLKVSMLAFQQAPATSAKDEFQPWSGLEFSSFSMWHFLELVIGDFLRVLRFSPLLHQLTVSAKQIKLNINIISTLSTLLAQLSLHATWTWHTACGKCQMQTNTQTKTMSRKHSYFFYSRCKFGILQGSNTLHWQL